jgi:sulfur-carrier protein adenylyltransferase/sulfurtransferase
MTEAERERYARQILLPGVGIEGQRRLARARVLCIGAGGLGSPAALYLAAAGVGTIGLADADTVDVSNLQRQVLYSTDDVGRHKLDAARARLASLNPHVDIKTHASFFDVANAAALVAAYDVVLDGSDNFPTRYLVNDACVLGGKPNVYGSIHQFEGQVSVFAAADGPCYRCLHPEPPPAGAIPSCAEAGVLGVLPGVVGTLQATEALKLILGIGDPLVGRLVMYDALRMRIREIALSKDADCPVCGPSPSIGELRRYDDGRCPTSSDSGDADGEMTVLELKTRIDRGAAPIVVDVREPSEFALCHLPGARSYPLGELSDRSDELPEDAEVVVHCKTGLRSRQAAAVLRGRGFTRVRCLKGGIVRWAEEIDPSMPRY